MPGDETRFNELKMHFGSNTTAVNLTLAEFAAMSDKRADKIIGRICDDKIAGEISLIRKRAIQASLAQPVTVGRHWFFICCERMIAY